MREKGCKDPEAILERAKEDLESAGDVVRQEVAKLSIQKGMEPGEAEILSYLEIPNISVVVTITPLSPATPSLRAAQWSKPPVRPFPPFFSGTTAATRQS